MMFASMMIVSFVFFIIGFVAIVIIPLAIGLPLLITGIVRRGKCIAAGVKPKKASIIVGSIFCGIPVTAFVFIAMMFIIGSAQMTLNDMKYNNVVEYWKAGDSAASSTKWDYCDIRSEFLKAAEDGDREALVALYSDNAKAQPDFDKQIDEFMSVYRKGFLEILKSGGSERSNVKSYEYPSNEGTFYQYDDILCRDSDEKIYGMLFLSCSKDANDAGNIGMHSVRIYSADIAADELTTGIRKPLTAASYEVNDNVPDDLVIIGNEISRTDSGSSVIDYDAAIKKIKAKDTIDNFTKTFGKPFAQWKNPNTSVWKINSDKGLSDTDEDEKYANPQEYLIVVYNDEGKIKMNNCYITGDSNYKVYLSALDYELWDPSDISESDL